METKGSGMLAPMDMSEKMSLDQHRRWREALAELRLLEEGLRRTANPILFHGTSYLRAARILRDGFEANHLLIGNPDEDGPCGADGIHWGTVNVAEWAAGRKYDVDDPPVLLAARLSQMNKAGTLAPDWNAIVCGGMAAPYDHWKMPGGEANTTDPTWEDTLAHSGTVAVVGCRSVEGMGLIHPMKGEPVHPNWQQARDSRLEDAGRWYVPQPAPWIVEDTPETAPTTMTAGDVERQWAAYGKRTNLVGENESAPAMAGAPS